MGDGALHELAGGRRGRRGRSAEKDVPLDGDFENARAEEKPCVVGERGSVEPVRGGSRVVCDE